ncbi:MAG: cysteine desulfurase family protein, partial [Alphaproteobacteria bacterium]
DSVLRAAGCATLRAEIAPVDPDGVVDLEALAELLQSRPDDGGFDGRQTLVAVMLANNETGVIEPVAEAAEIAHAHGALLHCDAVQAVGKIPIEVDSLGADLLSLSAHKTGGPQGAGTLVVRQGVALTPQLAGGRQERGLRAGTENVAAIAGFGAACDLAGEDLEGQARLARLRDDLEARIGAIAPGAKVFGGGAPRLANTSCFTMPGVSSETQVMALDLAGIAVSAGAACSSGKVAVSHVLRAMGVAEDEASSAIRVSLGWRSRRQEIDKFLAAWRGLYARAGAKSASAAPAA